MHARLRCAGNRTALSDAIRITNRVRSSHCVGDFLGAYVCKGTRAVCCGLCCDGRRSLADAMSDDEPEVALAEHGTGVGGGGRSSQQQEGAKAAGGGSAHRSVMTEAAHARVSACGVYAPCHALHADRRQNAARCRLQCCACVDMQDGMTSCP